MNILNIISASRRRFGAATYRAAIMSDNPIAYWRLGESSGSTAFDEKVSHDGTYVGSPTLGVYGIFAENTAVQFNGSSQYVNTALSVGLAINGAPAVTIESWAKYSSFPATGVEGNWIFGSRVNLAAAGFEIACVGSTIRAAGRSQAADAFQSKTAAFSTTGAWTHIAVVLDYAGDTIQIYINGVAQIGSPSVTFGASSYTRGTPTQNDRIASSPAGVGFFHGNLDEVAIYPTALSAARIAAHYAAAGY
jgi:hypothetical protein